MQSSCVKGLQQLPRIWKSALLKKLKECLFISTAKSVLSYGCEAWTMTTRLGKQLHQHASEGLHLPASHSERAAKTHRKDQRAKNAFHRPLLQERVSLLGHWLPTLTVKNWAIEKCQGICYYRRHFSVVPHQSNYNN